MPATLGTTAPAGTLQSEAVSVGTGARSDQLPRLEPAAPFLMYAHPNRWMLVEDEDGWALLPSLAEIPVEPGVAGTDHRGDPSVGIAARTTKRGWTLIPEAAARPQDTPDGQGGYVRRIAGQAGPHHCTAWTAMRMVGNRPIVKPNLPSYFAWLRSLIDRNIIPAADPAVIEGLLDQHRERRDRAGARDLVNNAFAKRLFDQADAQVKALEQLLEDALDDDEVGEPVAAASVKVEPKKGAKKGGS